MSAEKGQPKGDRPSEKPAVDIARLSKARPTRIPRVSRDAPSGTPAQPVRWKLLFALSGALAAIVLAAYLNTLWGGLVFNDRYTLGFLSTLTKPEVFWNSIWKDSFTRPLTEPWLRASYAMDFHNYGASFGWYHLVNVFLQLCACLYFFLLVFRVSWRWSNEKRIAVSPYHLAFASAALFACHPLGSQSVAYLSARWAPLLAANFFLCLNGFLLGYLARGFAGRFWGYGFALAGAFMALITGAGALALPLTVIGCIFLLKPKELHWSQCVLDRPFVMGILVIVLLASPYLLLTGVDAAASPDNFGLPALMPQAYLATQFKALATYYVRCFLVPLGVSIDPSFVQATSFGDLFVILGAAMVAACFAAFYFFRDKPIVCLASVLILSGYLPHLVIIQQEAVADPVIYLSLSGMCLLAGWGFARYAGRSFKQAAVALGAVIILLCGLTIWRNSQWSSDIALFQATLATGHGSAQAHVLLSGQFLARRELDKALKEADEALKIDPSMCIAYIARGNALNAAKQYAQALAAFDSAVGLARKQLLPERTFAEAKIGLAESYARQHRSALAIPIVYAVMELLPGDARADFVLGLSNYELHRYQQAFYYLQNAVTRDPALRDDCWDLLSRAALELKMYDIAYRSAVNAAAMDSSPSGQILLARAALANGLTPLSRDILKRLIKSHPQEAEPYALMSRLEEREGDRQLSESYRKDALKLDPGVFSKLRLPELEAKEGTSQPAGNEKSQAGSGRAGRL